MQIDNLWSQLRDISYFEEYDPLKKYISLFCHLYLTLTTHNVHFYKMRMQMQANYYLPKLIVRRVSNDDEYLGVDAGLSPRIIDLMSLKQETVSSQSACCSGRHELKLDEYELAMAR